MVNYNKGTGYYEINLEYGKPPVAKAMSYLKSSMEFCKRNDYKCLFIIHGYGSSGTGGVICHESRQWLMSQKKSGKIKNVIFGEEFNIFNFEALDLKNRFAELKPLLQQCNYGVTVVEL